MGRRIRPIQSFGEDGERATIELGELMGLMSDSIRAHYPQYYDENLNYKIPEGKKPLFGIINIVTEGENMPFIADAQEAHYFQSEFDL